MKKAIFLDRDGVLNQTIFRDGKPRAPYTEADFKLFPGVPEAVRALKDQGYLTIIVTNQPDVARGWVDVSAVHLINRLISELVPIDDIKICFHTDKDQCSCRKPKPGMLTEAAQQHGIDLSLSYMIGDRHSDVEAGVSAGCKTILIGEGDSVANPTQPDQQFSSLLEASRWICGQN